MNFKDASDQEIIALANDGYTEVLEVLYLRYRDWVLGLAYKFCKSEDDAQDVLQETFIYLYNKFPGFTLTCQLKTFLYPVVYHTALKIIKKNRRHITLVDQAEQLEAPSEEGGAEDLHEYLSHVDETQRELLLLRFADGYKIREIADKQNIPESTVKTRLYQAISLLKNIYKK